MAGVSYRERVFVAGQTETGKSEVLNLLFSGVRCQRVLFDSKEEFTIPGVEPVVGDPEGIDWSQQTIHYVTATTDLEEVDALFRVLETRRDLLVCVHELGDLCEYKTNATPASVNRYLAKGGAHGRGLYGGSQLPVDMPKRAKSEIQHAYVTVPAMEDDHLKTVCKALGGESVYSLRRQLEEVEREHGPYSFMHFPKGAQLEKTIYPPLPDHVRAGIVVHRTTKRDGDRRVSA